jgi:Chemoreceptor zinc-binding domain
LDKKVVAPHPEALSSMTLKYILDTHHVLKRKLQDEMDGKSDEPLDITELSQDNLCTIGKWLYGEGKLLYSHLPEYEVARKVHADLHVCACDVLTQHLIGDEEGAQTLLKTKFRTISSKNQIEFSRLFGAART